MILQKTPSASGRSSGSSVGTSSAMSLSSISSAAMAQRSPKRQERQTNFKVISEIMKSLHGYTIHHFNFIYLCHF
jgi:hypothetical protein